MGRGVWLLVAVLAILRLSEAASFGDQNTEYDIFVNEDFLKEVSSDFIPSLKSTSGYSEVEEFFGDEEEIEEDNNDDEDDEEADEPPAVIEDPKVYGMNIGLHFILEKIKMRMLKDKKPNLEHLIKVLVLTRQIERADGEVNDCNMLQLKKIASLYPKALKEAIADSIKTSKSSMTDFF